MPCSPEKLAANRRNCLKSSGPKTPEGKAKSRRNGLKHGLTGAGVVLLDEDVSAVDERFEAFEGDLKPRNDVARFLARRAAMLSVRLDRCVRQESAKIAGDMLAAEDAEAEARAVELDRLIESIEDRPAIAVRKLQRSSEGIDWLIRSWQGVKVGLLDRKCDRWNHERAHKLSGRKPETTTIESRLAVLTMALRGKFQWLPDNEWSDLPDLERREAARGELAMIIDAEIARLEVVLKGLDHESIARDRSGARARAIFDPSREAVLARKYEAAAGREFFKTLKEIERINATVEESSEADATPDTVEDCGELASCLPDEEAEDSREARPVDRGPRMVPTGVNRRLDRLSLSPRAVSFSEE